MNVELIDLQENDYSVVQEIYNHYVENTTVTFGTEKVTTQELKVSIFTGHPKYKSYIIKSDGEICGFCYFSQYRKRQAYDRTAEVTIYLQPGFTGNGIGKETLEQLKTIALSLGIKVLIATITAENEQSIRLFEKCGFEKCAHFGSVGEKFNRVLDVAAYQIILDY